MDEYIKRDNILALAAPIPGFFCSMISSWDVVHMPTADVVEVVRCNDCIHRLQGGYCKTIADGRATKAVNDNFFCGYGERRDNNAVD